MQLSIIIVSWNVREKLKENLTALFQSQGELDYEVFVVNNASSDNTIDMVKKDFPQVNFIANQENLGFSQANNQAIKKTKGEYVLLLNPDMRVFPETLINIYLWMKDNEQAWVVGCRLIDENGDIVKHVRRFPRFSDQILIALKLPHFMPGVLNNYLRNDFDYDKEACVDAVRGGFFMIKRAAIEKIGLLDERFFVWFEEVDYCRRTKKAGGEVWYTPATKCIDYVGQSFKQVKRGTTQKYFRDSMIKYFWKWHPFWQVWLLYLAWPLGIVMSVIGEKLNIKSRSKT